MRVMPRYIRKKNTSKSCDCANANTEIPATLVSVHPDRTCIEKRIITVGGPIAFQEYD